VEKDEVSALLDLSGAPLFKRGYRIEGGIAPLRETTAAALLFLANWRRKFPLRDLFCGSGTIVIEAALYAWDMAPGLGRTFALSDMIPGDPAIERAVREELLGKVDFDRLIRIQGSDADGRAIAAAKANLRRAYDLARGKAPVFPGKSRGRDGRGTPVRRGTSVFDLGGGFRPSEVRGPQSGGEAPPSGQPGLSSLPELRVAPADDPGGIPAEAAGFIITNPPYGIRLGEPAEAEAAYREMAILSRNFPGWKLAVITDHPGFESHFGRKADSCKEITNGAIRSFFYQYEKL
jgi:putative N6-adenine-specific DNA methylase